MANKGDLRVWWIPQVPMKPFRIDVPDITTAKYIISTLAQYDAFQFENNIKPNYSNVGGLEEFDGDEWCEWEDDDGNGIDKTV